MVAIHQHSCTLCEATCGITVTTDGDRVVDIRGDEQLSGRRERQRAAG